MRDKQAGEVLSHRVSLDTVKRINMIRMALLQSGCFNDLPSKSWVVAECVRYAYEAGASFIAGYLPDEAASPDEAGRADPCSATEAVSPQAKEAGEESDSRSVAD